jgi:hypothetical protein
VKAVDAGHGSICADDAGLRRVQRSWFNRFRSLTPWAAAAGILALSTFPVVRSIAAESGKPAMLHPLVPFSTVIDHWDHHWFLWLPNHSIFESVEIASRETDSSGWAAVWVWFTERAGAKRQIHYRNDAQLARFVGGVYRQIDYKISGEAGRPRAVEVRFDDSEGNPVNLDVAFDPTQMLVRQGAGLTDQSGHMSDRAFLVFYRETNALALDAHALIGGSNATFGKSEPKGPFPFRWAYSHGITIGLIQYGTSKVMFGPDGYDPSPETGRYVRQMPWGGNVTLLQESGALKEYIERTASDDFLRVVFEPPLPPCSGEIKQQSSTFSISIAAAADVIKGRVETRCGGGVHELMWRPEEPLWASRTPFRSELSRLDEQSLSVTVRPAR